MATRLTVVETLYYESEDGMPHAVDGNYARVLTRDDQVYERRLRVGEEWEPLDCGWLGDAVSMLHMKNLEGFRLPTNPTPEERVSIAGRVIEVAYGPDPSSDMAWLVPPGETMRATPVEPTRLHVRCRSGTARFMLTLIPG